jgi:hypothetical protein
MSGKITASNWKTKNCTPKGRKNQWTVKDLKQYARDHGLKVSGNKAELCKRVAGHINGTKPSKPVGALARAKRGKPLPKPPQRKRRQKRKGTKKLPALPKPKRTVPLIKWTKHAKRQTKNGWTILCIPKGTLLAHGTKGDFPDKVVPRAPGYFANLETAFTYGFIRIWNYFDDFAEDDDEPPIYPGKIIIVEAKKSICVLDMSDKKNILRLNKMGDDRLKSLLDYAFNVEKTADVCRRSYPDEDDKITRWLCTQGIDGLVGWGIGAKHMKTCPIDESDKDTRDWHDEIVFCDPSKHLKRHPLELRQIYLPAPENKSLWEKINRNWPGVDKQFQKGQIYIVATWNGCAFQKYKASSRRNPQKITIGQNKKIESRIDYDWNGAWEWISDLMLSTRNNRDKWLFDPKARKL